jgi:hypothetical protein
MGLACGMRPDHGSPGAIGDFTASAGSLHRRAVSTYQAGKCSASIGARSVVEGCFGLRQAGRAVRQGLVRALSALPRAGEIIQEDELDDDSPEGQGLRLGGAAKARVSLAGSRDLLEIPPSELLAVLDRRFPARPIANEDDEILLRCVLEGYGFSPLTGRRGGPSNGSCSPPRCYRDYAAAQLTSGLSLAGLLPAQLQRSIGWCSSAGSVHT